MAHDLVPQVDVGSLTLRGLASFSSLLAVLTTDGVTPLAMIQLESLGALFHINGQYARKVPDLLCRCSSVRLDQLGMTVGWRKGDTASLMAQSAGGQAVAILCFCLSNTCKKEDVGSILYELSEKILSKSLATSSIRHLMEAADLLASKLQVIGFGNIMANQVVRIHDIFKRLDKTLPLEFFDPLTREATVELYDSLSKLVSNEDTVIRIIGIQGMCHIMTIVLIMFPDSVELVVESLLVQQGAKASIILEMDVSDTETSPTFISVEKSLCKSLLNSVSIDVVPLALRMTDIACTFHWSGHITDSLRIAFAEVGISCPGKLVQACCDVLLLAVPLLRLYPSCLGYNWDQPDINLLSEAFKNVLGCQSTRHIYHVCKVVFGIAPSGSHEDVVVAYSALVDTFKSTVGTKLPCSCDGARGACDFGKGWGTDKSGPIAVSARECLYRGLWHNVGSALAQGLRCLLIEAEGNVTVLGGVNTFALRGNSVLRAISDIVIKSDTVSSLYCDEMYTEVMSLGKERVRGPKVLARSDRSTTIFPACLIRLQTDFDIGFRYKLCDGQLLIKDRYYPCLASVRTRGRHTATKSLFNYKGRIKPSSSGEHSHMSLTIRECLDEVELRTTVLVQGQSIHLDLTKIICSSMNLIDCGECEHNPSTELDAELQNDVLTTSIAMPCTNGSKIAIVQTKGNPTAQLLACENDMSACLQRKCCLNCAVSQAKARGMLQIIVAC